MVPASLIHSAYIAAAVFFILGLKGLTHPRTAVRGNLLGAVGMLLAVCATLLHYDVIPPKSVFLFVGGGIGVGTIIGIILAVTIKMTAMPQLVALFNGFGGAASILVAGAEILSSSQSDSTAMPVWGISLAALLAGVIGSITFWGSLLAFAKLQELRAFRNPFRYPGLQAGNILLAIAMVALVIYGASVPLSDNQWIYFAVVILASILGLTLTNPIGGADMPVVIALLNSYSGLAAAATGFVLNNTVLIIAGSLVGASGIILTNIMCKAMNRSLPAVLFGVLQPNEATASADDIYAGRIKSTSADEVAMLYDTAQKAVIVPGYGMAVAQAQHAVRDLANILESRGCEVTFAIHPVAGRMPGHMNVLLAEAEVAYDKLQDLDTANPEFSQADVVLVIGANDVVNPLARTDPTSPIAGMPILNVDQAKTIVVVKRSLSPGFAGIPNPLFAADNCLMFFGDGKKAVNDLVTALKEA